MRIVIAGGSGFLGSPLAEVYAEEGHDVRVLTRSLPAGESRHESGTGMPGITRVGWKPDGNNGPWIAAVDGADAVINLAGSFLHPDALNGSQQNVGVIMVSNGVPTTILPERTITMGAANLARGKFQPAGLAQQIHIFDHWIRVLRIELDRAAELPLSPCEIPFDVGQHSGQHRVSLGEIGVEGDRLPRRDGGTSRPRGQPFPDRLRGSLPPPGPRHRA